MCNSHSRYVLVMCGGEGLLLTVYYALESASHALLHPTCSIIHGTVSTTVGRRSRQASMMVRGSSTRVSASASTMIRTPAYTAKRRCNLPVSRVNEKRRGNHTVENEVVGMADLVEKRQQAECGAVALSPQLARGLVAHMYVPQQRVVRVRDRLRLVGAARREEHGSPVVLGQEARCHRQCACVPWR